MIDHYYEAIDGFFWFQAGYDRILASLPRDAPSVFVEVGSYCGKSIAYFGVEAINRQIPVTIYAVDSFSGIPDQIAGDDLRERFTRNTGPLRMALNGRFHTLDMLSVEAATHFADGSIDAVWIDGDHSYEGCREDILTWFPKLKPGGLMGGDDWMVRGVQRAVGEEFAPHYLLGHGYTESKDQSGFWPWWMVRHD